MSRIRTIKPEFFTSEDIVSLSPLARLLYVAIWCEADKEGRLQWKPRTLKMRYLPGDDCDIEAICSEIVSLGLVELYGDGLAYVPSFKTHQHINPRERESILPVPDESTRQPRVSHASVTRRGEGKGKEGKGKEEDLSSETSSDAPQSSKSKKVRKAYTPAFERFWSVYPTDPLMSKSQASDYFEKLDDADQALAMLGVPALIEIKRKDPTYRMVHACRYLSQRRFETLAQSSNVVPIHVPTFNTPEEWAEQQRARHAGKAS